ARKRLRQVGGAQLSFTEEELREAIPPDRVEAVSRRSGGWPLAVALFAESDEEEGDLEELVWGQMSGEEQELLLSCCLAEIFTGESARQLSGDPAAEQRLQALAQRGPAVQPWTEGRFRLQPMFREFLRKRLGAQPERERAGHARLAALYRERGQRLEAVEHLLAAGRGEVARALLLELGPDLLERGRGERLLELLTRFPALDAALLLMRGHALRQRNRWDEALAEFGRAGRLAEDPELEGEALAGQARVYLDTVQPARAQSLLRQAFRRLSEPRRKADLLDLLAENAVNTGKSRMAARYRRWAGRLLARPRPSSLDARILLRTGQLAASRQELERRLESPEVERALTAHSEDSLILAYVAAVTGDSQAAEEAARSALSRSQREGSPQTEAVAWMRLGHALYLADSAEAADCYRRSLELAARLGVQRLRAEALMGLALEASARGDTTPAYDFATEALAITQGAGDAWLSAWLRLTTGIAAHRGGHPGAVDLLRRARLELESCQDSFGSALAALWLGLASGTPTEPVARRLKERGYGFVLERRTLFGPPLEAAPSETAGLRLQVLGPLRIWRGEEEVDSRAFKRRKARELLAVLALHRGRLVSKEQLMDVLFPEASFEAADRDFRVALHNLSQALEPERPRGAPARSIERRDEAYRLALEEVSLDLAEFERLLDEAGHAPAAEAKRLRRRAIELYRGDLVEDYPYADWAGSERERLKGRLLEAAWSVAEEALEAGEAESAAQAAQAMLERDPCCEEAYRILMRLHLARDHAYLATRVYEQCRQKLREELGVEPSPETQRLAAQAGHT
ncbi:MAG: BTAD domain-containing putative transcriptional regulator, partial [Candidatus Eremiobacterota bacterium]